MGVVRRGESRGVGINEDQPEIIMDGFIVNGGLSCFPVLKFFQLVHLTLLFLYYAVENSLSI